MTRQPRSQKAGYGEGRSRMPARSDRHARDVGDGDWIATAMGLFSVGLGLSQVLAPGRMARCIGLRDEHQNRSMMRWIGFRELACGIGIFARRKPAGFMWARTAGDVMDLALLGAAFSSRGTDKDRVLAATGAVAAVTALDFAGSLKLSQSQGGGAGGWRDRKVHVQRSITIQRSPEEIYRFWHDFQNLPRFMSHIESVQSAGDRRSHWRAKTPMGTTVEWDAEIVEDRPGELIAWRSVPGSDVENSGSVRFVPAPGGKGTEVHVDLRFNPPGGSIGAAFGALFSKGAQVQIGQELRSLKQIMELGEVVVSDATIHGAFLPQRPAQPAARRS
jgi:uncharacterized membrane protein